MSVRGKQVKSVLKVSDPRWPFCPQWPLRPEAPEASEQLVPAGPSVQLSASQVLLEYRVLLCLPLPVCCGGDDWLPGHALSWGDAALRLAALPGVWGGQTGERATAAWDKRCSASRVILRNMYIITSLHCQIQCVFSISAVLWSWWIWVS